MARDSKGWRIDRRRSVTRYSCQQAAGVAALPFPSSVSSTNPSRGAPSPSGSVQPSRSLAHGCKVTREYSPRKCSIDVFSARRGLSMALSVSCPPPPHPPSRMFRFPYIAHPPFSRVQRFIPRSWNTAAVTPSLALIGDNCSIFFEVQILVHRP